MLRVFARVWVTVCLGYITGFAAQLPPEMLVDKFLLQAKMLSEEKKHKGALEAMDQIVALQKEHDLTLPEDFSFQYAQTALAAGSVQAAIDSANRYLSAAGREGKFYREALELLVKAERRLQEPTADRVGSTPVKPDLEPQPQAVLPSSPQTQKTTKARPVPGCGQWNTMQYFQAATMESVTACLAAGADPMARNSSKYTPLHFVATYNKNPAVIEALLEAGADPMARDIYKRTPLYYAAKYNRNPAVTERLIKAGASLSAQNEWGRTPLQEAVVVNAESESEETTKAHPVVDCRKWNKKKFFRTATVAEVVACIKAGSDLKEKSWLRKSTPLHNAAKYSPYPEVIKALVNAGANPNAEAQVRQTPLHSVFTGTGVISYKPVLDAIRITKALLESGADPNARDEWGLTPLHRAILYAGTAIAYESDNAQEIPIIIQLLLDSGASVNAKTDRDNTPLHVASMEYVPEIMKMLIKHGADMTALNKKGKTPWGVGGKKSDRILDEAWEKLSKERRANSLSRQKQVIAARRREKQSSDPSFLDFAIGTAGGAAIAAAGGGTEAAVDAGTVFAESVITGKQPVGSSGSGSATGVSGTAGSASTSGGGPCQVPGYPNPPGGVSNLGFSWCPAKASACRFGRLPCRRLERECAIAMGSSSTPEQIEARRREIQAACDRLVCPGPGELPVPAGPRAIMRKTLASQ